jgi:putative two-component system response regulator
MCEAAMDETRESTILVVDDDNVCLEMLARALQHFGFDARECPSGETALKLMKSLNPSLILLDINMPRLNGYDVCRRLKSATTLAEIPIVFLSGRDDTDSKIRAFELGAADYITKPFCFPEVLARIRCQLRLRRLQVELKERNFVLESQQKLIELHNRSLEQRVAEQSERILDTQHATLFALSKLAESRDPETGRHLERMQEYTRILAQAMATQKKFRDTIDESFAKNIHAAVPLHDIGKVGIPDQILLKPGTLTPDEMHVMETHTVIGASTLTEVDRRFPGNEFIRLGIEITRSHHERWDGNGYPDSLAGEEVPLSARITALADVYDALTSKRCYKPAYSHAMTKRFLLANRGTKFDPDIVDVFFDIEHEFCEVQDRLGDQEPSALDEATRSTHSIGPTPVNFHAPVAGAAHADITTDSKTRNR